MPRPREFETDAAIEQAMQLFWAKGFDATSLDDLCDATGLGRSSLYAAFGDKRALLLKALDRYVERGAARISRAVGHGPIREGLTELLRLHVNEIAAGPGRRGCFVGNCTVELARRDPEVQARVRAGLERNESILRAALLRARADGELSEAVDAEAVAKFLISSLQGLRVVGKSNSDRASLEAIAKVVLKCVE